MQQSADRCGASFRVSVDPTPTWVARAGRSFFLLLQYVAGCCIDRGCREEASDEPRVSPINRCALRVFARNSGQNGIGAVRNEEKFFTLL
jgi:hypothetical protein